MDVSQVFRQFTLCLVAELLFKTSQVCSDANALK